MIFKKESLNKFILYIISDFFYISLITFLLFSVVELIEPRFISAFINLNALLTLVVITGIITIMKKD
jgi:hypothetical protein